MLVSIVIPAYNTEKYIRECIESCFRQTYEQIEVICVNDGSKDNTGNIIDSLLSKDDRLRVLHQENAGVTAARMAGTKVAQGHYIFYLDSDDVLPDHCIAALIQKSENGIVDMVFGTKRDIPSHCNDFMPTEETVIDEHYAGADCFKEVIRRCKFSLCHLLIKKQLCLQVNIPYSIKWCEDTAMLYQIAAFSNTVVFSSQCVYFVRCNPESTTKQANSKAFITKKDALLSMKRTVREYPEYKKIKRNWLALELIYEMQAVWESERKKIVGYKNELRKKVIINLIFHPSVAKILFSNQRKYLCLAILASLISQSLAIKILSTKGHHFCLQR